MRISWRSCLLALVAWHLICWVGMIVFMKTVGPLVLAIYTALFGDVQASIGRFQRSLEYIELTTVTLPASASLFPIFDWLSRRRTTLRRKLIGFAIVQVPVLLTLIWSYETAFFLKLNQWDWSIFGPPVSIYNFRNIVLPRLIAWQMSTTPIVLIALWLYVKLTDGDQGRIRQVDAQNVDERP